GLYRRSWVKNQLLFRDLGQVLEAFRESDIDTLLLKGSALAVTCYGGDVGVRPMRDFDILVRRERAAQAIEVLEELGWTSERKHWLPFSLRYDREFALAGPNGFDCDLHWLLLEELVLPDARERSNDEFWDASEEVEVGGVTTRVLGPADQLLHVCVHGPVWYSGAHVYWAADAVKVLERAGLRMDWDRLVGQATKRSAQLPVRDALRYLAGALDAAIPHDVIDRLDRVPTSRRIERAYRVRPV